MAAIVTLQLRFENCTFIQKLCENENSPISKSVCTERRVLKEADYPLLERVLLGPIEDEGKIFIMEKDKTHEVSSEVS